MKIVAIRPAAGPRELAYFDIEIGPHLRLFNLVLKAGPNGQPRTYSAKAFGKHSASFHPELAQEISNAAVAALRGQAANVGH